MRKFIDQLFNRRHYLKVIRTYDMVLSTYRRAYELFIEENSITPAETYKYQEYITECFPEIQQYSKEIQVVKDLNVKYVYGLNFFLQR